MFPKNQSQILSLPWEYYISRNIPIWHDELTLLYNNDARGWPAYKLPANYAQLRAHRGDFADFYHLMFGQYGRDKLNNALLRHLGEQKYVDFSIKYFKERGGKFIHLAKELETKPKTLGRFFEFYGLSCCLLDFTSLGSKVITDKILELLGQCPNQADIIAYYAKSPMLSPMQKMEKELAGLRGKKIDIEREAKRLHKKYCWIPVSFVSEPWGVEYFVDLLKTNRLPRRSSLAPRNDKIPDEAKYFLRVLGVIAGLNEYRKGIFSQVSLIIRPLLDKLARENNLGSWKDINLLTHKEILDLVKGRNDYQKQLIEKRKSLCMMYTSGLHKVDFLYGGDVLEFEKKFKPSANGEKKVKGIVANKGKVVGKAKIISGPIDFHKFKQGDILIAKMTSVDFLPIMKKASAFVTDEGGLACHAAIISREYNVPCVIGTGKATAVFKDGDMVEVDAEKGIVRREYNNQSPLLLVGEGSGMRSQRRLQIKKVPLRPHPCSLSYEERDCCIIMLIFLHGPDTFRSRQQLKKMIEKFKADRDPQGYNVAVLDCQKEDGGKVMEQVLASPFMSEKRMVVLENFLSATGKGDIQEEMLKRVTDKTLPESTVLVFYESPSAGAQGKPKTSVAKKLFEILSKEKFCQQFDAPTGFKLQAWVEAEFKTRGGKISQHALQYLSNNIGGDMWRLNSLIEQLIAYKSKEGNEVELADVQLFLDEKTDDSIFNLVDAIVGGQAKKAFEMIREQYRIGEDAQYVFAMLLRQFRILLEIRDLYEREDNLPSDTIAKKLGLHPFVVKKSLPFIKRYPMEKLKSIYQSLLDFDVKTKTGQGGPELLLDVLVGKLASV